MSLAGVTQLANWTVGGALGVYYRHAAHRLTAADALPSLEAERPLHFFRGMLHFRPAAPFLDTLKVSGFRPRVFEFPSAGERNFLRQWRENTADVVRHFVARPEALGERPVFCGHSAGGLTVYTLAALADGGDVGAIRRECPGLTDVPVAAMERLAERLARDALFVTIASPHHGVRLTRVGRCVNRFVIEPRLPLLFSGITRPNLEAVHRRFRRRPEEVIDANLVSSVGTPSYHGGSVSRISSRVIQGGMRAFSPFLDHECVNDGIVPLEAAVLDGPAQVFAPFDHLKLVETPEAALTLADLIRQVDPFAEKLS
jgi:hypothetical protein